MSSEWVYPDSAGAIEVLGLSIPDLEMVVIGGGAVGLAIARALALEGREVVLLEQHEGLGYETSSRNSEVIHAGIYYPPGSLKARLCVAGKQQLYVFCAEHGVPHRRIGKLLVATRDAELGTLAMFAETARKNGVDDLLPVSAGEVRALEPEVLCAAGLLSPSTGIIDSHAYLLALAGEAEAHGAQILLRARVDGIEHTTGGLFSLRVDGVPITCRQLVMAAGLHTSALAGQLRFSPKYAPPQTSFARGRYYALRGQSPFSRLVYPMPVSGGLGTHVTLDMGGRTKFGPDVEWIDELDYSFNPAAEAQFYTSIRAYWPGLPNGALQEDGTGIRPKLSRAGDPAADFAIHFREEHGLDGLVMLFGIESPGLTASLAIGEKVAGMLARRLG